MTNEGSVPVPRLRLHGIDALRGIAASSIVVHHVVGINQMVVPSFLGFIPAYFGYGVPLFFIVSAFSLYYTYLDRMEGRQDVCKYMVRRFARIAPLFYFMVVVWYLTYHFAFGQWLTLSSVISNATFTFNLVPASQGSIVWAGWSIGTEYTFYFFLPLLINLVRDLRASILLLILAFLAEFGYQYSQSPIDDYASILTHMPFFAVGIIAFFIYRKVSHWTPEARRIVSIGLVAMAILSIAGIVIDSPFRNLLHRGIRRTEFYMWCLPFGCMVLSQAIYPLVALVSKATRFLGQISYSMYLLHPWIVRMCRPMYLHIHSDPRQTPMSLCLATLATFAIVLPVSWLAFRSIEVPGMNWGRRWFKTLPWREGGAAVTASAGARIASDV
jgi:peptidoglycan/LPS O-acetylase OafA/YrhL